MFIFNQTVYTQNQFPYSSNRNIFFTGPEREITQLNYKFRSYLKTGYYDKALIIGKVELELAFRMKYPKWVATSYNNIGKIYEAKADYEKAIANYYISLRIEELLGDESGIAESYMNIGAVYWHQLNMEQATDDTLAMNLNYSKSLQYYKTSLNILKKISNVKEQQLFLYNNIGDIYYYQNDFDEALKNYLSALALLNQLKDSVGLASSYNNLGSVYSEKGDYSKALAYYFASLKIQNYFHSKHSLPSIYNNIAETYEAQGNYIKAQDWYKMAAKVSHEVGAKQQSLNAYKGLSDISEKTNNYFSAYRYLILYSQIKDSMFRKETNKQIEEIKIKYATEKKEKAIAVLKNEKQIQELNFQRLSKIKEKEQLIFFGVLLIVLIVASALFYWFHLKQKIILEREMTAQKLFRFQEVIEAQERERKRISEDLHDSLGQILSTIKLNLSSIEDAQFVHEKNNFVIFNNSIKYLDEACQDVRNISHNLMPSSLIRLGLIPALHNLIDSINLGNQFNVSFQNVGLKTRFSELTEINIYRIIQEALNNMMKHSNASEIKIKISQDEENVSIQISDNGVGFNTENLMKAKGIGWKNIYSRVSILNGIITVKSAKNEGVKIYIQFKVPIKSTNDNEKK